MLRALDMGYCLVDCTRTVQQGAALRSEDRLLPRALAKQIQIDRWRLGLPSAMIDDPTLVSPPPVTISASPKSFVQLSFCLIDMIYQAMQINRMSSSSSSVEAWSQQWCELPHREDPWRLSVFRLTVCSGDLHAISLVLETLTFLVTSAPRCPRFWNTIFSVAR